MNILAYFHAYKFTHFSDSAIDKTQSAKGLSLAQKIKTLVLGVNNPRPQNHKLPDFAFETIRLKSNKEIECWLIKADSSKGTVILFNGYSAEKSSMLDKAAIFHSLGYTCMLVDFMGTGGSEGNQTTIGFYEAEEVKTVFDYIYQKGERNIFLFGTSMGAVAIMKAQADFQLAAKALIIECPFSTMLQTVKARFKNMKLPALPMAHLLVFWGGVMNNFNAFSHNPEDYAFKINCPVLLLYGEKDDRVSKPEIENIYKNLNGAKILKIYPEAGHDNYLNLYKTEWKNDVDLFLKTH